MLFKLEIIEAEEGLEPLVYTNPYPPHIEVLVASSPEGTKDEKTAFMLRSNETISFRIRPGAAIYGRTRIIKEEPKSCI